MTKNATKKEPPESKDLDDSVIRHVIWTAESFNFKTEQAMQYINSGLLGYETGPDGQPKTDNMGRKIPRTIHRATYFRHKQQNEEMPQMYKDLRDVAFMGYTKLMLGFQEQLAALQRMSAENLLALTEPLDRQEIINAIVDKIIPARSAFADLIKKLLETNKIREKEDAKKRELTE